MKNKQKTYKLTIEFDSKESAHGFFAHWLDGGGDGGGNIDWNTQDWKDYNYMRVTGTGYSIDPTDGVILTPEIESERFNKKLKELKKRYSK